MKLHIYSGLINSLAYIYVCRCADEEVYESIYREWRARAESIGVDFTPLKQSLKETVDSLIEKGFFKLPNN